MRLQRRLGVAAVLSAVAAWARGEAPALECGRVVAGETMRVDGRFDEETWRRAPWFEAFRQSVPDLDQPATEPTGVAFVQDERHIYVAVRCDDSRPDLIRANKLRHRDDPDSDDHVAVIFDTYRDQVRGTLFVVNPLGAKEEALVNGPLRYTVDWDEVWDVKTQRTATGWQAELRIPLRVLRYAGELHQTWGVNVARVLRREQEESYVSPPPPPHDISSINYAATLSGLELGPRQRNLQAIPYALGGAVRERDPGSSDEASRSLTEVGLDVKYSLTSDLTLDGTFNTDFAQVESDDEQINLTRFSLFYPEKRQFFLDNAALFTFGAGGGPPGGAPAVTPFFSRRIGLHDGTTVPIDAGARLTGKAGRQDIGVLSVRTGAVPEIDLPAAWYNVARARRDLGDRSFIGAILTNTQLDGFTSTTAGVDGEWWLTPSLVARGNFQNVSDSDSNDTSAYDAALDLTTDPWGFLFEYRHVDEGYDPDLGFVRRDGYDYGEALLRYSFRPGRWGVRRVSLRSFNEWFESLAHDALESSENRARVEVELENGDGIELQAERTFERLFDPFDLDDELVFPAGDYTFYSGSLTYESDESRRWGVDAELVAGEFYDGDRTQAEAEVWVVASRHLRLGGSYSTYNVSSPHGDVDWLLWAARVDYTFSSVLSASAFLQRNSAEDATVLNLRLRWILPNDSDLFVVYDDRDEDVPAHGRSRARELAVKVSYRFFL